VTGKSRKCTDILCLLIFLSMNASLVAILASFYDEKDVNAMLYG